MQTGAHPPWRDRSAIGASIAFHCCVLALLAAVPLRGALRGGDEESALVPQPITIEHRLHVHPRARPAPAVAAVVPARRPPAPPPRVTVFRAGAPHVTSGMAVRPEPPRAEPPVTALHNVPAPAYRPAERAVPAEPAPASLPSAAAVQALPQPTASAAGMAAVGNLGEDWPARPTPSTYSDLGARIHDHAVVDVTVDEHGRALSVTVVSGSLDDAARALLASVSYIPARCNGLDCEGKARLRF